jgi:hypothetical protein
MNPHEIKVGHCYSLSPVNGRRTVARVTNLFRITAMAAYEHSRTETLELNPVMVRFVWRYAAYPTGWSRMSKRLLLEEFVMAAEKEVAST